MTDTPGTRLPPHADLQPALIVGLGASAGGIAALQQFFAKVPEDSGVAYVVILHLSPDHDSRLAEVLQTIARVPVTQVTERVRIDPNHVYVVPPNRTLEVSDHHILVKEMTRPEQRRAAVDLFFRTLADAHGSRTAAVVLSGTGPNGSSGIKRIKEYGGLTIAQDPNEAEYGDMPRNSIATGLVDMVLPVARIPARIAEYSRRLQDQADEGEMAAAAAFLGDADAMRDVLTLVRVRTGQDFSSYKPTTLHRRVQRRIQLHGLPSVASYARSMREHPDEAVALMKELLISVTNFFRDPEAFEALSKRIPAIFAGKQPHDPVRVWVPGCATGEEAYSIAMLLTEHADAVDSKCDIQLFATDLDEQAIAIGRDGFYSDAEIADLTEARLARFFQREAGGYHVRRDLREKVLFARHNVIKDPPFSHLDLISCRNLLIYLTRSVQERVIETFHFALRPGGCLLLGLSESSETANDLFLTVDRNARLYESRTVTTRIALPVADPPSALRPVESRTPERITPAELHHRVLEQYAPPSMVVTEEHQIVHLSEHVGRYLVVPGGEPTRELMRLVHPDLRPDLRMALHQAGRQRSQVEVPRVRVGFGSGARFVNIVVRPAVQPAGHVRGYFVVIFDEAAAAEEAEPLRLTTPSHSSDAPFEEELARVKAQLRTNVEQFETQVEEAKASNEELQAMNEELRSAAEELETSKEELQSVNEELTTVNQELKVKIEELALTNSDFQNLINSSEIGTIFLDRFLRIKLCSPMARSIFNVLQSDIGRPLSDITSNLFHEGLHEDVKAVLAELRTIDREVETRDGRWHLLRLRPYRTLDDRIDGVVITFQDITDRRRAEEQVRRSEARLRLLIDSALDYAIFTMTVSGNIDSWNPGAQRMFGYTAAEILGKPVDLLFTAEDRAAGVPRDELARAAGEGRASDERYHVRKNGDRFYCSGVTTPLVPGADSGFAKIARDLTEQRRVAEALREVQTTLERRVEERTRELVVEIRDRTGAEQHAMHLLRKLVTSQEDERARIARDLHDQLGQQLTGLRLSLERLAGDQGEDEQLRRAVELANTIDRELGFLAWELRPAVLDDLGLAAAMPRYVREWSEHYGVAAEYRSNGLQPRQLSRDAQVAFYRIAQEALNNVAKHAHATRVDVILECRDGTVRLVVEDDGIGFDASSRDVRPDGLGLMGMHERAALIGATLHIEATPGKGTSVFLTCPIA